MLLADLDASSPVPLYRQLRTTLERAILRGDYQGRWLPSTRALATELNLARNTVERAYEELIAEGFVATHPRVGLYVNTEMAQLLAQRTSPHAPTTRSHTTGPDWSRILTPLPEDNIPHVNKPPDWFKYPYSFLGGQPDPSLFPTKGWLRCLRAALEPDHIHYSLQDSQGHDDPLLVEQLCSEVLPARGIDAAPEEVMVTLGSQEGLYLTTHALIRPFTIAAVEEPGYPDTKHILLRAGAKLQPVPVDDAGLTIPEQLNKARLLCITPSHQFPTNVTLSAARRQQLLHIAVTNGMIIVEDDYDSEFRYHGRPTPALKANDHNGLVIYLGSFSKFLAPGLRLGFLVANPALIRELKQRRRYMIRHASGHQQRAMALFIQSGQYTAALRRARIALKARWTEATHACHDHLPCTLDPPPGGVSLWLQIHGNINTATLAARAAHSGVLVEPGHQYFTHNAPNNYLRLGFGSIPLKRISQGIRRLASVTSQLTPEGIAEDELRT